MNLGRSGLYGRSRAARAPNSFAELCAPASIRREAFLRARGLQRRGGARIIAPGTTALTRRREAISGFGTTRKRLSRAVLSRRTRLCTRFNWELPISARGGRHTPPRPQARRRGAAFLAPCPLDCGPIGGINARTPRS